LKVQYVGIKENNYNKEMLSENRILLYECRLMIWRGWYTNYSISFQIKRNTRARPSAEGAHLTRRVGRCSTPYFY
jgi:hypothetical protein